MTLTVALEGSANVVPCNNSTNWNCATIAGPSDETDIYMEGSQAVSAQASKKAGELYYDYGAGTELDFTVGGGEYQNLIFININVTTLKSLDSVANNGLSIRVYTDLSNYVDFTIAGYDYLANFRQGRGGFVWFALDPTLSPTSTTGVSFDLSSIRYIGVHIGTTASAKSENLIIDGLIVAKGLRLTGTDANGWLDAADYCTAYASRAWGCMDYDDSESTIYSRGYIWIGDTGQTAPTSLTDSGRKIKFIHTEYYYSAAWIPMIQDNYLGITVDDAAGFPTTFEDGILVGSDNGRSGSLIEGDDDLDLAIDLYGGNNANSVTKLYGTTFKGITGSITWGNDSDHLCYGVTFEDCCQFDPVGAVEIRNCRFINTNDDQGTYGAALVWNANIDIEDCQFIANSVTTNSCGIEHGSTGTFTYTNLVFSGNDKDVLNTTAGTVTIQNDGTSNAGSAYNQGGGNTYFQSTKTVSVHVEDEDGNDVAAAQIYIDKATPDAYTSGAGNSQGDLNFVVTEALATDIPLTGWLRVIDVSEETEHWYRYASVDSGTKTFTFPSKVSGTCEAGGSSTLLVDTGIGAMDVKKGDTIRNETDGSWAIVKVVETNQVTTTPLQGGTDNTWETGETWSNNNLAVAYVSAVDEAYTPIMNKDSDVSGDASMSFNYQGDRPIVVRIRKSTAGTRYKPWNATGTIDTGGFHVDATLIEDDIA